MGSSNTIDWTQVRSEDRWKILKFQKRFFLWALYTSIGSMMLGKFSYETAEERELWPLDMDTNHNTFARL